MRGYLSGGARALGWVLSLGLGWFNVDLWLRRVTPPAPAEGDAAAALRLWRQGKRSVVPPLWAAFAVWLVLDLLLRPRIGLAMAPLIAAIAVVPVVWGPRVFLRLGLRKQFPHLASHLPRWRER